MASSESAASVASFTDNHEDKILDMSDTQLYDFIEEVKQENEELLHETEMFEKYLKKFVPTLTTQPTGSQMQTLVAGGVSSRSSSTPSHSGSRMFSQRRSKSRSSTTERLLALSAEQKYEIAQREIEAVNDDLKKMRQNSDKVIDTQKAIMEEADNRLTEIMKCEKDFEKSVVTGGMNPRTQRIISERVKRYFEDWIQSRDTLIDKLTLKNSSLRIQKRKVEAQLHEKEEIGEVLHKVDYTQLKIENKQNLDTIEEKNEELLKIKVKAGKCLQLLNAFKKKLDKANKEEESLDQDIRSRQMLMQRIQNEAVEVEQERRKAEELNVELKDHVSEFAVPPVMDYVAEKAQLHELQRKVQSWRRKVEIAEMSLKTSQRALKRQQSTMGNSNSE